MAAKLGYNPLKSKDQGPAVLLWMLLLSIQGNGLKLLREKQDRICVSCFLWSIGFWLTVYYGWKCNKKLHDRGLFTRVWLVTRNKDIILLGLTTLPACFACWTAAIVQHEEYKWYIMGMGVSVASDHHKLPRWWTEAQEMVMSHLL